MARTETAARPGKGDNQVSETIALVRAYAKQETIDPLKGIGRYVAFGVGGSVTIGIGVVLLVLALLRALQTETGSTFDGNWSAAPYAIVLVVAALVIAVALAAANRGRRGRRAGQEKGR